MKSIEPHNIESLEEYVRIGRPLGSFLEAVLSNDLMDAFGRADYVNRTLMFEYCCYLHNKMPMACHGSREAYKRWCQIGGREGLKKQAEQEQGENENSNLDKQD